MKAVTVEVVVLVEDSADEKAVARDVEHTYDMFDNDFGLTYDFFGIEATFTSVRQIEPEEEFAPSYVEGT